MATYPALNIGLDSSQEPEQSYIDDISTSGTLYSRALHSKQYYRFTLVHPGITAAQVQTLDDFYAAGPRTTHTLTYRTDVSPQETYSVVFLARPRVTSNLGGAYTMTAELRGFKN